MRGPLQASLWAAAQPRQALILWALVTLLPLPGLLLLRLDTDGRALVPRRDPAVLADAAIRERFHLRDPFIVFLASRHPDGIYNPGTLRAVQGITDRLREIPEIGPVHVMSLATEKRDRLLPGSHDSFIPFLEPFPASPARMADLRHDLDTPAARVYTGTLVASDRRAAAVFAGVANGRDVDRREVHQRIEEAVRPFTAGPDRVHIVGAPAAESLLGDHVLRDLALLVPLSVLVIAAVLWIGTRRAACVLLALGKAGLTIAWTFGVLGSLGIPVYLTIAVLPVVLATMSIADEVHLLMRYQRALREEDGRQAAVERTLGDLVTPVVLATTTTAVGFLSFLATPIDPVRAFGFGAAVGIAYSLGFSLLATPALLAALPERRFRRDLPGERPRAANPWPEAARHPGLVLGGIALVTFAAVAGLPRLDVHDGWIESFSPRSAFRRATGEVDRSLHGTQILDIHLTFPGRNGSVPPCADPAVLARLGEFGAFLRAQPGVGGALGLQEQLTALAHFWAGGQEPAALLADGREILRLLNRYEMSPGLPRRRQVVTDGFDETLVTVFLKNANYRDTRALLARIGEFHRDRLAPLGARLAFAGDVAVSQATIPAIVRTQVLSLPLALAGVFAVIALLYGSARLALLALLPVTVSALWLLGSLAWLGIPLGIATSMFFGIALGLGVDSQSIHFLDRYHRLRRAGAGDARGLVQQALADVGPAVAVNTAAVASGFGLLAFSSVPANARLGLMIALSLVLGAVLTLAGLGALLTLAAPQVRDAPERKQAMKRAFVLLIASALVGTLAPPLGAQEEKTSCQKIAEKAQADLKGKPRPKSFGFPALPEMEFENSLISFRVCKVKKNLTPEQEERRKKSWKCCDPEFYDVELVKLDAYMRLCREAPILNELGFREMRFTIEKWELFGHSKLYDADIVFSATPGIVQPKSLAFSNVSSVPKECQGRNANSARCKTEFWKANPLELSRKDFPALIIYNAIYDVFFNGKKIVSQEPGIAMARGAMQIPPTAVTVAFQKPIDIEGVVKICPGTCAGMVTITEQAFKAGLDVAQKVKSGQLKLDKNFVPEASKRKPTIPNQ